MRSKHTLFGLVACSVLLANAADAQLVNKVDTSLVKFANYSLARSVECIYTINNLNDPELGSLIGPFFNVYDSTFSQFNSFMANTIVNNTLMYMRVSDAGMLEQYKDNCMTLFEEGSIFEYWGS